MALRPSFDAHGHFGLAMKGNLLFLDMEGSWNLELVIEFEREFPAFLKSQGNPAGWGVLTDLRRWEGATPEAMERIAGNLDGLHSLGMKASARVVTDGFFNAMIDHAVRMDSPYRMFTNTGDALGWLASLGFAPEK